MITIIDYQPRWPKQFLEIAKRLKAAVGPKMLAIHHIGSTSIPGTAAKDVIDIQITVSDIDKDVLAYIMVCGFIQRKEIVSDHHPPGIAVLNEDELLKVFFQLDKPAVNLHIRKLGKFNQRYALLCRDYLRNNPAATKAYEQVKINLAKRFPDNMTAYYEIKDPVFDILMAGAEIWAKNVNWVQPESDL
ncbi:GrpB family protein [Desertivirga arenae]|uniref:GrpB family protein n=1 Tax=Desertivirga arenae TaxID=2810309 RepID=UPI001A959D24|nr:GrpB family protein [Pedobacter sp. SYSU D00823]